VVGRLIFYSCLISYSLVDLSWVRLLEFQCCDFNTNKSLADSGAAAMQ